MDFNMKRALRLLVSIAVFFAMVWLFQFAWNKAVVPAIHGAGNVTYWQSLGLMFAVAVLGSLFNPRMVAYCY